MDISFIIVCLIVAGCIFVPFLLFILVGQNETKKIKKKVKRSLDNNALNISQSEIWGNTYIGITTDQKIILFLKFSELHNEEQLIYLNNVKGCEIVEKRKAVKINDKRESILEKLDLVVSLKTEKIVVLNFYDYNGNYREDFELKRIEKWKAIMIDRLANFQLGKKVA